MDRSQSPNSLSENEDCGFERGSGENDGKYAGTSEYPICTGSGTCKTKKEQRKRTTKCKKKKNNNHK